jgi:hypothetical protein
LLIYEIRELNEKGASSNSRPTNFFKYKIKWILFGLNISSGLTRISGSAVLFLLSSNLKQIDEIIKLKLISENEEKIKSVVNSSNVKQDEAINIGNDESNRESYGSYDGRKSLNKVRLNDGEPNLSSSLKFCSDSYYKRILKDADYK